MTFYSIKTSIMAVKTESTDSTLLAPDASGQFTVLREGFSFQGAVETLDSDELVSSLAGGATFAGKETPTASIPKYLKHSGTEGTAPDWAPIMKSAFGNQNTQTEYDTINGSTAGTSSARGVIKVDSGEGANYAVGRALLIKDGTNGYSIRNVYSISTDDLTINKNLASAPASGVNLGQCIAFSPATSGHPTFSAWLYQQETDANNAFIQAIAGCRTTSISVTISANGLAEMNVEFAGTKFYYNPIEITNSNKYIDITDDGGTIEVVLDTGWYKTPKALATHITTKATSASDDVITCTFSSTTGKYTLASDGSTFSLLWQSGTNSANSVGSTIGFTVSSNDTGSTSYTADSALTYDVPVAVGLDDEDPYVCKSQELFIGDYTRTDCRESSQVTLTVATPKQDIDSICAESGVSASVTLERETTFSTTLYLQKHEVDELDDMLNNTSTEIMFNGGPKDNSGNWIAGRCMNFWLPLSKITTNVVSVNNGLYTVDVEARGTANSTFEDIYFNLL